jgi:succinyl-CoA:acetate CoA-transferase
MAGPQGRFAGDLPQQSAAEAAAGIPPDATVAVSGFGGVGYPKAVPLALAESGRDLSLTLVSGGGVGEEIDEALLAADAVERRYPFQAKQAIRDAINDRQVAFHDRHISRLGDEVELGQLVSVDVAVVEAVAVGPDWLIPSTSIGLIPSYVAAADELIVEVNHAQPLDLWRMHDVYHRAPPPDRGPLALSGPGDRVATERLGFDPGALVAVVDSDRPDDPYEFRDPTQADQAIASHLAAFLGEEMATNPALDERVCVQFGVGSLGNAVVGALRDVPFGDRAVCYFGEVIQDGMLDLLDDGLLDVASATSLALSTDGQARLFDGIGEYAERTVLRPATISNNPELVRRYGVVAINSAVDVDIYGHVNSTHIGGTHVVNGIGGSGDFARNALLSIVALPATAKDGAVSRVLPFVQHVDHTEHEIDVFVTEHGVVDMRGLAPVERAEAIIDGCADPRFVGDLRAYLDRATEADGHLPHDFDTVFDL